MLDIRTPFPPGFRFGVRGDVVAEADALAAVESEVGLFVPACWAVWVWGDFRVDFGEFLL